jgi:hypothetical protein
MQVVDTRIVLSGSEESAYRAVCTELAEKSPALHAREVSVADVNICTPRLLPYHARYNNYTKCSVTGEKIFNRQPAVIIFCWPPNSKRIILGVIKDVEVFSDLLVQGSFSALRAKKQEEKNSGKLPPRPRNVLEPRQQMCFCVQCGKRILRPEEMKVGDFGKVYRCTDCISSGKSMKLGQERYCRTCGTPFTPTEQKDRSARLCQWHRPNWRKARS